jgi:hypothetical protein
MTRLDRRVLVVVGLVALTAAAIGSPRSQAHVRSASNSTNLPGTLGSWVARPVSDDGLLMVDRRSPESLIRSYENGARRASVALSLYTGENGPDRRPDINALISGKGVTHIDRTSVQLAAGDRPSVPARRLTLTTRTGTINVWYWYRLGSRAIGDEYTLRFWMGANSVLHRIQPLLLVRVATTGNDLPVDFIEALDRHVGQLDALSEDK